MNASLSNDIENTKTLDVSDVGGFLIHGLFLNWQKKLFAFKWVRNNTRLYFFDNRSLSDSIFKFYFDSF